MSVDPLVAMAAAIEQIRTGWRGGDRDRLVKPLVVTGTEELG